MEFSTTNATAGSTADYETEDMDSAFMTPEEEIFEKSAKTDHSYWDFSTDEINQSPKIINLNKPADSKSKVQKFDTNVPSSSAIAGDKWWSTKEKFLDLNSTQATDENVGSKSSGVVIIKESYIEPPRINRVSRSFHGKTLTNTTGNETVNAHRRASDNPSNYISISQPSNLHQVLKKHNDNEKIKTPRHKFITQLSQPNDATVFKEDFRKTSLTNEATKSMRFTTVKVDEDAHAVAAGYANKIDVSFSKSLETITDDKRNFDEQND